MNLTRIRWMVAGLLCCLMPAAGSAFDASRFEIYTYDQFRDYWYSGRAEISRYSLEQSRYGEIHDGDAVMIFVTEKMNPTLQVKADNPGPADITVMKLNAVRKFFTGIYPYSVLTSVFSPVEVEKHPNPLKISSSVQEWCGNVYQQMNLGEDAYRMRSFSYFEKEGDEDYRLPLRLPEDALWNLIRITPALLPTGEFFLIPGMLYSRFMHRKPEPQTVEAQLVEEEGKSLEGNPLVGYSIYFPKENRTLKIVFETRFPYRIQSWEDTYPSPKWTGGKVLTSRAVRTHTLVTDYWHHHGNKDRKMLHQLGLSAREMAAGDK